MLTRDGEVVMSLGDTGTSHSLSAKLRQWVERRQWANLKQGD